MADIDGLGEVNYMASGVKPSATVRSWNRFLAMYDAALLPPWGADTHDGYDIYAGNWPVIASLVPPTPLGAHKASEGLGTYDARFGEWVRDTAARHRYRGAYHVIWPWRDGKPADYIERQADAFLDFTIAKGVDWSQPGWFVQIDNEQFSGMPRAANVAEVRRFADRLHARIGRRVSHYCNPVTDPTLFFAAELADLPKWEAQYNRNPSRSATAIRQWGGWSVAGIWNDRPVDANFIEKVDVVEELAGYVVPPQEEDMTGPESQQLAEVHAWMSDLIAQHVRAPAGTFHDPFGNPFEAMSWQEGWQLALAENIDAYLKSDAFLNAVAAAVVAALPSGGSDLTAAEVADELARRLVG